eukprot:767424-Hanusia_phi.AAC.6
MTSTYGSQPQGLQLRPQSCFSVGMTGAAADYRCWLVKVKTTSEPGPLRLSRGRVEGPLRRSLSRRVRSDPPSQVRSSCHRRPRVTAGDSLSVPASLVGLHPARSDPASLGPPRRGAAGSVTQSGPQDPSDDLRPDKLAGLLTVTRSGPAHDGRGAAQAAGDQWLVPYRRYGSLGTVRRVTVVRSADGTPCRLPPRRLSSAASR